MARAVILVSLLVVLHSTPVLADGSQTADEATDTTSTHPDAISDTLVDAAGKAGVDPVDLAGAVSTTGLDPLAYLCKVGELSCPEPAVAHGRMMTVRLTYYLEYGRTASGGMTYAGSTACSYNFPFGTKFRVAGEVFTCNDRGALGSSGWLDLWRRPDLAHRLGPYATVEVMP